MFSNIVIVMKFVLLLETVLHQEELTWLVEARRKVILHKVKLISLRTHLFSACVYFWHLLFWDGKVKYTSGGAVEIIVDTQLEHREGQRAK